MSSGLLYPCGSVCMHNYTWNDTLTQFLCMQASLLSQLQHPNIVSYKESFQDQSGEKDIDTESVKM